MTLFRGHSIVATTLMGIVMTSAAPARAQPPAAPTSPRTVFGRQERLKLPPHWMDLTMSMTGGYDDEAGDGDIDVATLPFGHAGVFSNIQSSLRYTRAHRDRRLTLSASDALRFYPNQNLFTSNFDGAAAFSSGLWRSARFDVAGSAGYTPYYQFDLFPSMPSGLAEPPPTTVSNDFAIAKQTAITLTNSAQFSQKLGRRSGIAFGYDRRSVTFQHVIGRDLLMQGANIRFSRQFTRNAGVHVGFGSRVALYGRGPGASEVKTRDIDVGLDYARPLSLSRRTSLSFSSGSSLMPQGYRNRYRITGNATLNHEISRTWRASAQYSRALQFIEVLPEPYFSDTIAARLAGKPSRRLDLVVSGAYVIGDASATTTGGTVNTYTAGMELGVAINRHVAMYSDYRFFKVGVDDPALMPLLVTTRLRRQTAHVGLKFWVPVLH